MVNRLIPVLLLSSAMAQRSRAPERPVSQREPWSKPPQPAGSSWD